MRQIETGQAPKPVGLAEGVCPRTVRKLVNRYRREGWAGLGNRSSRTHCLRRPTPQAVVAQVEALRCGRPTGKQIVRELCLSPETASRILKRLNMIDALEPADSVRRYERAKPGKKINIGFKKIGRFNESSHRITGDRRGQSNSRGFDWESVHVAIEGLPSIAFAKMMPNEKKRRAIAFVSRFHS